MSIDNKNVWGFWKIVAILMIVINFIVLLFLFFKFNLLSDVRDAANNIDSSIVFSLTLLQTFIAFGAFAGFWMIKNSAEAKAIQAARQVANERMAEFIKQQSSSTEQSTAPDNKQGILIEPTPPGDATQAESEE